MTRFGFCRVSCTEILMKSELGEAWRGREQIEIGSNGSSRG